MLHHEPPPRLVLQYVLVQSRQVPPLRDFGPEFGDGRGPLRVASKVDPLAGIGPGRTTGPDRPGSARTSKRPGAA